MPKKPPRLGRPRTTHVDKTQALYVLMEKDEYMSIEQAAFAATAKVKRRISISEYVRAALKVAARNHGEVLARLVAE